MEVNINIRNVSNCGIKVTGACISCTRHGVYSVLIFLYSTVRNYIYVSKCINLINVCIYFTKYWIVSCLPAYLDSILCFILIIMILDRDHEHFLLLCPAMKLRPLTYTLTNGRGWISVGTPRFLFLKRSGYHWTCWKHSFRPTFIHYNIIIRIFQNRFESG